VNPIKFDQAIYSTHYCGANRKVLVDADFRLHKSVIMTT